MFMVKNLPDNTEDLRDMILIPSGRGWGGKGWGGEEPLEEGTATYCSILAWEIPWTEELGRLHSTGSQRVRHN